MTRSVRAGALSVVVIALVLGLGWAARPLGTAPTPPLTAALASVPLGTTVVGVTDWRQVRASGVPRDELSARDVSTRSELGRSGRRTSPRTAIERVRCSVSRYFHSGAFGEPGKRSSSHGVSRRARIPVLFLSEMRIPQTDTTT